MWWDLSGWLEVQGAGQRVAAERRSCDLGGARAPLHHVLVVFVAGFAHGFCSGTGTIPFSPALKVDNLRFCFIDEAEHPLLAAAREGSRALGRS